jgi:hypothetical protein
MASQCMGEDQAEHLGWCTSMRQDSTRLGVSVQESALVVMLARTRSLEGLSRQGEADRSNIVQD